MDQITVERTDSSHATEDQSHVDVQMSSDSDCYEVECLMPAEEVIIVEDEEEDENVYTIEVSNAEDKGKSYKFTIKVDQSPQTEKAKMKPLVVRENQRAPAPFGSHRREISQKRKMQEEKDKELVSNKRILKNRNCKDVREINSGSGKKLECHVCPPGRFFKQPTGLTSHLREVHKLEMKKSYLYTCSNQTVHSQTKLEAYHTKRDMVFTCPICSAGKENQMQYCGPKWRKHMETQHPGVIPDCDICNRSFTSLLLYFSHQFRHLRVSPFYCAKCQSHETSERSLSVDVRNHDKKEEEKMSKTPSPTSGAKTESSEADDSDF